VFVPVPEFDRSFDPAVVVIFAGVAYEAYVEAKSSKIVSADCFAFGTTPVALAEFRYSFVAITHSM
jgi:hypothetical protein